MLNLSLKRLKLIAENRGIKGYKDISKNILLSILNVLKPIKNKTIGDIKKEDYNTGETLKDKISFWTNKKNKTTKDIRRENFDADKVLRDIRTLFKPVEDYYKPIKIDDPFDDN